MVLGQRFDAKAILESGRVVIGMADLGITEKASPIL